MPSKCYPETHLVFAQNHVHNLKPGNNQAGIHAREWIAPAVSTFLVRELVEDYAEHPDYIDKINW